MKKSRRTSIKPGDRVEVIWEDACSGNSWQDFEDKEHDAYMVKNVGYVQFCDKRGIKLTQGLNAELMYRPSGSGFFYIPAGMIQSIKKI